MPEAPSRGRNSDQRDRLLVIGAGPVGLALARHMKEHGIAYDHVEADDDVGGNWYHGVYDTAHIISSRRTTEYADFPMPAHYPDFPSAAQMLEYLRSYADHFDLREIIELQTRVVRVVQREDELWAVELSTGERRVYKGVVVCTGHHWDRRMPTYPGEFTGEILHSKDYKHPDQIRGRRVLVVGGGNSACDIASEAARVSSAAHLSLRRGYWFLPKTIFGVPLVETVPIWTPVWIQRLFLGLILRIVVGRYESYGLPKPGHRIFEAHPTINSELLHYVRHGRIRPRSDIARLEGDRVLFTDGTSDTFDVIVYATGYAVSFPFLPRGMVPMRGDNLPLLYGGALLPDHRHLYIVGTLQLRYGFGPFVTSGADLLARVMLMQDRMELPIGLVLREMKQPLPESHLVNPGAAIRSLKRGRLLLPLVERRERRLRRKYASKPWLRRIAELQDDEPSLVADDTQRVY